MSVVEVCGPSLLGEVDGYQGHDCNGHEKYVDGNVVLVVGGEQCGRYQGRGASDDSGAYLVAE